MAEQNRSCENCGNTRCANSIVAFWWDECVASNFEKHWRPRFDVLPPLQDKEDLIQQVGEFQNYEG
jgi:hypothetical protein